MNKERKYRFEPGKTFMPYFDLELEKLLILYKWKSKQIEIPYNIELFLRIGGSIGYYKERDLWVTGQWTGETDNLNRFTRYVCKTLATTPETFELDRESVVVCGNNKLYLPDEPIIDYVSKMKTETDISIYYQLVNSRNIPMLVANNDKIKKEIEAAFDAMRAGRPVIITTQMFDELEAKDIVEPNAIEKMQYLSSFYEVLEKRNASCFGIDIPLIDKKAQVNTTELDNFGDISTLSFLSNYICRKEFCQEMKDRFNINIEVVRNPIYSEEPKEKEINDEEDQKSKILDQEKIESEVAENDD